VVGEIWIDLARFGEIWGGFGDLEKFGEIGEFWRDLKYLKKFGEIGEIWRD